jgi:hypothetical protein
MILMANHNPQVPRSNRGFATKIQWLAAMQAIFLFRAVAKT